MFIKRKDAIRKAQSYLAKAIIINSLVVFIWPLYIFFSKHIGPFSLGLQSRGR